MILIYKFLLHKNLYSYKNFVEKLSLDKSCHECGLWLQDVEPKHFHMPCPSCKGKGCEKCDETGLHPLGSSVILSGIRITE